MTVALTNDSVAQRTAQVELYHCDPDLTVSIARQVALDSEGDPESGVADTVTAQNVTVALTHDEGQVCTLDVSLPEWSTLTVVME